LLIFFAIASDVNKAITIKNKAKAMASRPRSHTPKAKASRPRPFAV